MSTKSLGTEHMKKNGLIKKFMSQHVILISVIWSVEYIHFVNDTVTLIVFSCVGVVYNKLVAATKFKHDAYVKL